MKTLALCLLLIGCGSEPTGECYVEGRVWHLTATITESDCPGKKRGQSEGVDVWLNGEFCGPMSANNETYDAPSDCIIAQRLTGSLLPGSFLGDGVWVYDCISIKCTTAFEVDGT